ncbi:MAG TPA: YoaK family protein [Blastocatellia bacterium]|nr:YoaK family protein [Blastocatellia bacterium]
MRMSAESSHVRDLAYSNASPDLARLQSRLPPLLSLIAGMVDVIGYLTLGKLFTAHVTGNLVVIAALLVRGGPPNLAQVLAVPVYIGAVAAVWVIAKALDRRGPVLATPLLLVQFALLACVLIVGVIYHPSAKPQGLVSGVTAMIAVSAMACQFALLRLAVPRAPSTAVMTGNLTNSVLSLLDTLSPGEPLTKDARERLQNALRVLIGFFAGCVAGAAAVSWLPDWAWLLPVLLAGIAVIITGRKMAS